MRWIPKLAAAAALALLLQACAAGPQVAAPPPAQAVADAPITILVSIDSFRPDYLDRGITPTLSGLAAAGVRGAMTSCFPTKTFPNHYSLVTGKCADGHGIVANRMVLPGPPRREFGKASVESFWWDQAEPIWVSAERAGIRTGVIAWPGSAAERAQFRPALTRGWAKESEVPSIDTAIGWLDLPQAERPRLIAIYLDPVDEAGHDNGPDSPAVNTAIARTDGEIERLQKALQARGIAANFVIASDHGMAATSRDRVVLLTDLADPADYEIVETGTYASLFAKPGREAALERRLLAPHPHVRCWRKAQIPGRLHYGRNPRVPPYFCLADIGWSIAKAPIAPDAWFGAGDHGWDNAEPAMRATFIASGPAFRANRRLGVFPLTDVYPLLRRLTGLPREGGERWRGVLMR